MNRRHFLLSGAAVIAAACAPSTSVGANTRGNDPLLADPSRGRWPAFVYTNLTVREAYEFAAGHQAELQYIPCYCGCGQEGSGHQSNAQCFVTERMADGTMILEPHGSQCGTCVGIALDTKVMLGQGKPLREIRATIDKRWSAAGPGTPTPLP